MKSIKKTSFLFILLQICLSSCEDLSDCEECYFTNNTKEYTVFNEGSFWVYEDTALKIIDSIKMQYNELGFSNECSIDEPPSEYIEQILISTRFNKEGYNLTYTAYREFLYGNQTYLGF